MIERFLKCRYSLSKGILGIGPRTDVHGATRFADSLPGGIGQGIAVIVGDVRSQQFFIPKLFQLRRPAGACELGRDAQSELTCKRIVLAIQAGKHAQRHQLIFGSEELFLQPREILRPLPIPISILRRA
jgi:hypothetical protein